MKKADGTPMIALVSTHVVTYDGEQALLSGFQDITAFKEDRGTASPGDEDGSHRPADRRHRP